MSNDTQQPKTLVVPRDKKTVRSVTRMRGRANYLTRVATALVTTLQTSGLPRFSIVRRVGPPGLIKHMLSKLKTEYVGLDIPVPVVHVVNEQERDDRGFRKPIGKEILLAAYQQAGMVIFGGKHMYDARLFPLLSRTFPDAVSAAAYVRGLGSPTIGNGIYENVPMVLKDITSLNSKGEVIHAGTDGSGRIHPAHPIFERIGFPCVVQPRINHPTKGVFVKGTLVPDERCVDENGQPTIWVDWLQVKGKWKSLAMKRCGMRTGAFDPKSGILTNPELLSEKTVGEGFYMGILQVWDRKGYIRWCFEILERVADNDANRKAVVEFIKEHLEKLDESGGLGGIFDKLSEDNYQLQLVGKFCEKLTEKASVDIDPLKVPFVEDFVNDDLMRQNHHLRQGAGKKSLRFVTIIDNGVPPGHAVIGRLYDNGEWRFNHGDEIAVARFPMILSQALKVLKVIDPRKRNWRHLEHLLIKTEKGEVVTPWVVFLNEKDLVKGMQGDDDGDTALVDYDPRVINMYKSRISMVPGWDDVIFLIEPGKVAQSWKSKLKLVNPDGTIDLKVLELLGQDGRGPVGQLTFYCSMFLALGMRMHALACAVLIQEAIDAGKHVILGSDPEKLSDIRNWKRNAAGDEASPVNCQAKIGGRWDDGNGHLNMKSFMFWVHRITSGAKLNEVLTWREGSEGKKCHEKNWCIDRSESGENLVHFCNVASFHLMDKWKKDNAQESPRVDLADLLPQALGISSMKAAHPKSRRYSDLLKKSGLPQFGSALWTIRRQCIDPDDRNTKIEAEQEILAQKLRQLSLEELVLIWVTELFVAKHNPEERKSKVNRAFRAITFTGSPVLESLGIEMELPCQYLDGDKLESLFEQLQQSVKAGEEQSLFHATVHWGRFAEDHEEQTGTPAEECNHCRKLLESKVVSFVRNLKENLNEEFTKRVGGICHDMNSELQKNSDGFYGRK
ncbi:hypothetical protein CMI37_37575 [Candidatus Pacearchaeota archaeon]|nr:hypothetical protein [Candidatus Pacearchaeota archaeon]